MVYREGPGGANRATQQQQPSPGEDLPAGIPRNASVGNVKPEACHLSPHSNAFHWLMKPTPYVYK